MEYLILVALMLLNGFFAMSEIAIVTSKKSRLTALAARGNGSAAIALKLSADPTQFLSAVQIGITSISLMNGILGEAVLAEPFALYLTSLGLSESFSSSLATVLVVVLVTYLSIVVGELVPKRVGQLKAEYIACWVARPMVLLAIVTKPFVLLLTQSTQALMRLLNLRGDDSQTLTEDDIHALLDEGSDSGILEAQEHVMVKNVLQLEERPIKSMMIPRRDMVFLDASQPFDANYAILRSSGLSRFPVCQRNADNLIGIVEVRDLLEAFMASTEIDLKQIARPFHAIPETVTAVELLEFFRRSRERMVFVVDEYGDVKGLVTVQDLLVSLTGEVAGTQEEDASIIQRDDGSFLLDGMLPIHELKSCLGIQELPDEDTHYQTLSGLLMQIMGKMPHTGDKVACAGWQLEIVDMDGRRVDKVLAARLA
jgi:putative hemolysin